MFYGVNWGKTSSRGGNFFPPSKKLRGRAISLKGFSRGHFYEEKIPQWGDSEEANLAQNAFAIVILEF
jgi:hypothetical protein